MRQPIMLLRQLLPNGSPHCRLQLSKLKVMPQYQLSRCLLQQRFKVPEFETVALSNLPHRLANLMEYMMHSLIKVHIHFCHEVGNRGWCFQGMMRNAVCNSMIDIMADPGDDWQREICNRLPDFEAVKGGEVQSGSTAADDHNTIIVMPCKCDLFKGP
jgi:hypothetical protein